MVGLEKTCLWEAYLGRSSSRDSGTARSGPSGDQDSGVGDSAGESNDNEWERVSGSAR